MSDINFFALEAPIVERIKAALPDHEVLTAPSSEDALEWTIATPGVFVIPGGETVNRAAAPNSAKRFTISQRWVAVSVTRNVAEAQTGAPARADAGRSVYAINKALNAWEPNAEEIEGSPTNHFGPLVRITGAGPIYRDGLLFYPVTFETEFTLKG